MIDGGMMGCIHCKPGFHVDDMTGTCMKDQIHHPPQNGTHHPTVAPESHIVDCTQPDLRRSCHICIMTKHDFNGQIHEQEGCLVCNEGYTKGTMGGCHKENNAMRACDPNN